MTGLLLAGPVPAEAVADPRPGPGIGLTTCTSSNRQAYKPGLRVAPRRVQITADNAYTCVSTSGVSRGYSHDSIRNVSAACLLGDLTTHVEYTIRWNSGRPSRLSIDAVVNRTGSETVFVFTGKVTEGQFAGAAVTGTAALANPDIPACLSRPGAELVTGAGALTILE